jgi:heat shock protein HspQ
MIPIEVCTQLIQRYIFELKGVIININPNFPKEEDRFIEILNIVCNYYGITL